MMRQDCGTRLLVDFRIYPLQTSYVDIQGYKVRTYNDLIVAATSGPDQYH